MSNVIRKIKNQFGSYRKYILIFPYLIAGLIIFNLRSSLYNYIPLFRKTPLGDLPLDLLLLSLMFLGSVCIVQEVRAPFFIRRRFRRAVMRAGLHNDLGEYPRLIAIHSDSQKEHGQIYEVLNYGISVPDFDKNRLRLGATLNGIICRPDIGRKATRTLLYFIPQKYVRPVIISLVDNAFGPINIRQLINLEIIGATGTGKTVSLKLVCYKILRACPNARLWVFDYKQFDFRELSGLPRYYGFTNCVQGIDDFYEAFKLQQKAGISGIPNYLIIDEWGSFINSLERKEAERMKARLAEILMLGRAYQYIPIVGIQRPDASYFNGGRDNFQACLALGNLSPEGRRMAFPGSVLEQVKECRKREGHLYIDGIGLEHIQIEDIPNIDSLDAFIRDNMSR